MLFSTILVLASGGLAAAAGDPCSSLPYKPLLYLSTYKPAESYCTAHYPLPTKTVTASVTAAPARRKRFPGPELRAPAVTPNPVWSSLVAKEGSVLSTFCSCIETQLTVTVTVTTTPCPYPSSTITPPSCTAVTGNAGDNEDYVSYSEFAAYQGATQPLDGSVTESVGDGTTSTCDAIQACADSAAGVDGNGFIVAYHTDLNSWVCQNINSEMTFSDMKCYIKSAYGYIRGVSGSKQWREAVRGVEFQG